MLKLDQQEYLVLQPQTSLKEVQIHLEGLNIPYIAPACGHLIGTSHKGWDEWVRMWQGADHVNRVKRELSDRISSVRTGISLVDATNIEVLTNELSYTIENIGKMGTASLEQLSVE